MENGKSYFYILMAIIYVLYQIYEGYQKRSKSTAKPKPVSAPKKRAPKPLHPVSPFEVPTFKSKQKEPFYYTSEGQSLEKPIEELHQRDTLTQQAEEVITEDNMNSVFTLNLNDKETIRNGFILSEILNKPKWVS
jgi:hypothetical protein